MELATYRSDILMCLRSEYPGLLDVGWQPATRSTVKVLKCDPKKKTLS